MDVNKRDVASSNMVTNLLCAIITRNQLLVQHKQKKPIVRAPKQTGVNLDSLKMNRNRRVDV